MPRGGGKRDCLEQAGGVRLVSPDGLLFDNGIRETGRYLLKGGNAMRIARAGIIAVKLLRVYGGCLGAKRR